MQTPALGLYIVALARAHRDAGPGHDLRDDALARAGRFAGLCSAIGVCLGILVHTALAALGLGAILQLARRSSWRLKLLGAAYLVYLGCA